MPNKENTKPRNYIPPPPTTRVSNRPIPRNITRANARRDAVINLENNTRKTFGNKLAETTNPSVYYTMVRVVK